MNVLYHCVSDIIYTKKSIRPLLLTSGDGLHPEHYKGILVVNVSSYPEQLPITKTWLILPPL